MYYILFRLFCRVTCLTSLYKEFNEFLQEQMEFAHLSREEPDAKRPKHEGANAAVEEEEQQALAAAWKEQLANLQGTA